MSQFIDFQAVDSDLNEEEEEEGQGSSSNFIDDLSSFNDQSPTNYRLIDALDEPSVYSHCGKVERSYEDSEFDYVEHEESATDFSNLIFGVDDNEQCFNESNSTKIRIGKFEKSLKQVSPQSKDSFYNAVICSLYFNIVKAELLSFNEQNTQIALGLDFISRLNELKDRIRLSVEMNDFEPKMHLVNDLLFEKKMFLRLFKKKSKFRYLIKKGNEKKNEIKKEVLACIDMHCNGFNVSCHLCNKDQQIEFQPVDIICKPVKRVDEIIECFYSTEIFQAFTIRLQGKSRISTHTGHLCYYCNDYCAGNQSFEGQLKSCTRNRALFISSTTLTFQPLRINTV